MYISVNIYSQIKFPGVYIFLFDPSPPAAPGGGEDKNMPKYHVGGKKLLKGDEKMHIFPPICKKYAIFSPIDFYKITKKILTNFACGAHHLIIINFLREKKGIKKGGGGNSKFNIHSCKFLSRVSIYK